MSSNNVIARNSSWSVAVDKFRQDYRTRIILQIMLLIGIGALSSFLKKISPAMGVPGSSAILWLSPLVAGRILVRKDGAAVLAGTCVALWGVPLALNHGLAYNMGLYGGSGLAIDIIARAPLVNIRNPFGAVICGVLAHLVKFGFIMFTTITSPVVKVFEIIGVAQSFGLHIAFGAAAGLAAWIAYRAVKIKQKSQPEG